jgi:DNA invertase Pin-like site-specific DNA recombinase
MRRFVAYYRVSTDKQGRSGLGLESQRQAAHQLASECALVAEFIEVESGKRADRPQLTAALSTAKRVKAVLVIAKLDRLARNVHFISGLLESGVEFVAVDMPMANKHTIHILAAVTEHEREMISQRTSGALRAAKERGVKLGSPRIAELTQVRKASQQLEAEARASNLAEVVAALRAQGFATVRRLTDELNRRHAPAAKGGAWHIPTVHRLLTRLKVI